MNMPLPVEIFEGRSLLERYAYSYGYMPAFIFPAIEMTDVKQQIKNVALFLLGSLKLLVNISKPFNPILG